MFTASCWQLSYGRRSPMCRPWLQRSVYSVIPAMAVKLQLRGGFWFLKMVAKKLEQSTNHLQLHRDALSPASRWRVSAVVTFTQTIVSDFLFQGHHEPLRLWLRPPAVSQRPPRSAQLKVLPPDVQAPPTAGPGLQAGYGRWRRRSREELQPRGAEGHLCFRPRLRLLHSLPLHHIGRYRRNRRLLVVHLFQLIR